MLHTASLLVDDIEDNSELRRGIPVRLLPFWRRGGVGPHAHRPWQVAHHIYGVPSTINSANYIMFLAMERCNKLGNAEATAAFLAEMIKLHEGQGFDILWRDMLHWCGGVRWRRPLLTPVQPHRGRVQGHGA